MISVPIKHIITGERGEYLSHTGGVYQLIGRNSAYEASLKSMVDWCIDHSIGIVFENSQYSKDIIMRLEYEGVRLCQTGTRNTVRPMITAFDMLLTNYSRNELINMCMHIDEGITKEKTDEQQ